MRVGSGCTADAEAVQVQPVAGDVLLWLEHDDVNLGGKQAAQHHEATQTDRYAHGGGLYLKQSQTETHERPLQVSLSSNSTAGTHGDGWL